MKHVIRAAGVLAIAAVALVAEKEFRTSTPGVTYVLTLDGNVEFRVPADFVGVAITPDGRNLYLAN